LRIDEIDLIKSLVTFCKNGDNMGIADFYDSFFPQLQVPGSWTPVSRDGEAFKGLKHAYRFQTNDGYADVWVAFSGRGRRNERALKVERYWDTIEGIKGSISRVHSVRDSLIGAKIRFQSDHGDRKYPEEATGTCRFAPFDKFARARTAGTSSFAANSVVENNQEIGLEHKGKAGGIVVWRPEPITIRQGQATKQDIKDALNWFHSVMKHI